MINSKRSCERKLLHTNYVEALAHAACVPNNETVVVYSCDHCGAHHVGHSVIFRKITKTESRIARAKEELRTTPSSLSLQERNRNRIRDLERHLAQLRKLVPTPAGELAA